MVESIGTFSKKPFSIFSAFLVGMALMMLAVPPVFATPPEKKFKGKIIVSTKRFPSRFKSDAAMNKHMKKANTHELFAEGEKDWEFEYMAFLKKPVNTLQANIAFYDVTVPGTEQYVDGFTFYVDPKSKKDKIIAGHQRLSRMNFRADRKYLMVFARGYGQRALATTQIVLRDKKGSKKSKE